MELDPLFADSDGGEDVDVEEPHTTPAPRWTYPVEEPDRFPRQSDHYATAWPPPNPFYSPAFTDPFETRRKRSLEADACLRAKKPGERGGLESGAGPSSRPPPPQHPMHPEVLPPRQVAVVPPTVQGGGARKKAQHPRMRRLYSHEHTVPPVPVAQVKLERPSEPQQSSTNSAYPIPRPGQVIS